MLHPRQHRLVSIFAVFTSKVDILEGSVLANYTNEGSEEKSPATGGIRTRNLLTSDV